MNISVRQLTAREASALVCCFRKCYGDTYPNDVFYDADALAERICSGRLLSVAAFDDANNLDGGSELIGHTGLNIADKAALISEAGNTVVDPAFRGRGILGRLSAELSALCQQAGFKGYVHFPTTAHAVMQKQSIANGGVETGLMLGYVPADTTYTAIEQSPGRIAATIAYQPLALLPPALVYLPSAYADLLAEIYQACNLERQIKLLSAQTPEQLPARSIITKTLNVRRGLLALVVEQIGSDFGARMTEILRGVSAAVIHIDLLLDDPHTNVAVATLNHQQFFFAGLLPQFRRTDVLRLQRCADQSLTKRPPLLCNLGANRLFEWMRQELDPQS